MQAYPKLGVHRRVFLSSSLVFIYSSHLVFIGSSPAGISQKMKDREGLAFAVTGIGVEKNLEMQPAMQGGVTEFQLP